MSEPTPTRGNTFALAVTYHPEGDAVQRLHALARQFERLLIVDNHSGANARAALRELAARQPGITLIENSENTGIAAALNQGCRIAVERGAQWLATFDQDSDPRKDLLARVSDEWEAHPRRDSIGLIGVNYTGAPTPA